MTSVAQASSTRARAWRSTILPVSWLWTSMVFSSRWWGWFHNTILEEGHVGLSCYGSYAYVRAYGAMTFLLAMRGNIATRSRSGPPFALQLHRTTVWCGATTPRMRTLKVHFPDDALPTLDTFLKQTKEARVFRRAQAVRNVVKGQRLQTVSDTLSLTYSALRKWVYRFASQGTQGLVDRPRSGRPPKMTCELEQHLNRLVDQDPLQHGSVSSQWSCQELATVLAQQTGVQLGRESVRCVLKKR